MSRYQKVGDWLVGKGLITPGQRDEALATQRQTLNRFGEVIVSLGFCTEDQVVDCLAEQYELPRANVDEIQPQADALRLVSPTFALSRLVLPVSVSETELHCVFADPLDLQVTDYLTQAVGKRLVMSLAGTQELFHAIARSYALPSAKRADAPVRDTPAPRSAKTSQETATKARKIKIDRQTDRAELLTAIGGIGSESIWEMYGD